MTVQKRHSNEFKAQVALEAIRGDRTITEIAQEYEISPSQVTRWKQEAEANFAYIFDKGKGVKKELKTREKELEQTQKELGKRMVEVEFLKKKWEEIQQRRKNGKQ